MSKRRRSGWSSDSTYILDSSCAVVSNPFLPQSFPVILSRLYPPATTYTNHPSRTEPRSSIEPVIILKFVHLDSFPLVRRREHIRHIRQLYLRSKKRMKPLSGISDCPNIHKEWTANARLLITIEGTLSCGGFARGARDKLRTLSTAPTLP